MGKEKTFLTFLIKAFVKAVTYLAIAYYACVRYFFNFAFARIRRVPFRRRIKKHMMTEKVLKERIAYGEFRDKGKKWFDHTPYREVSINSADGLQLGGYYFHNPNARRIVLCVHGYRSSGREDFGNVGKYLLEHDSSLLIIDQRAHGKSAGEYITFGISEASDVIRWKNHIKVNISNTLPIYLYGISMGGATVLYASGRIKDNQVKGIIADCAFSSPEDIFTSVMPDKCRCLLKPLFLGMNAVAVRKSDFSFRNRSVTSAVSKSKVPILFIHGDKDDLVPVNMTYTNYAACVAPKRLTIIRGAGHAMSYMTDAAAYEEALENFFKTYDV